MYTTVCKHLRDQWDKRNGYQACGAAEWGTAQFVVGFASVKALYPQSSIVNCRLQVGEATMKRSKRYATAGAWALRGSSKQNPNSWTGVHTDTASDRETSRLAARRKS